MRSAGTILCILWILGVCAPAQRISSQSPAQSKRIVIAVSAVLDGKGGVLQDTRIVIDDNGSAPFRQVRNVRRLPSLCSLLGEHALVGVLIDYVGNPESLFVREYFAEKLDVRRFVTVVEFCPKHVAKLAKHAMRVILLECGKARTPFINQARQNLEVNLNKFVDSRFAHLEHYLATISEPCSVDLSDGSAPKRLLIEKCENLVGRCAQIFSNDLGDCACGQRPYFILQLRKFRAIHIGQQIPARRKRLAELYEHGPELLAGAPKMLGPGSITGLVVDELIVYDTNAMTCHNAQDLAIALTL